MISYISGTIIKSLSESIIIDTGSIGYEVMLNTSNLSEGESISVWTHQEVQEKEIKLFGFQSFEKLEMFKILISISGIGPKTALNMLDHIDTESIVNAVRNAETGVFTNIPGIGKKGAQRIIFELRSKFGDSEIPINKLSSNDKDLKVITESLQPLGFNKIEIGEALEKLDKNLSTENKIREVIKILGK